MSGGGIIITDEEAMRLLASAARDIDVTECRVDHCTICPDFALSWWELFATLPPMHQEALRQWGDYHGVPFPPRPKEGRLV